MAVRFDASADYLNVAVALGQNHTLMGWFYLSVDKNDYGTFFNADADFHVGHHDDGTELVLWDGSNYAQSGFALSITTWFHLAWVRAGNSNLVYIDGTQRLSLSAANADGTRIRIGNNEYSEYLNGRAAYVKAWSRNLSQAEVLNEMRTIRPQMLTNFVGWWPLLAGASERTQDYFGALTLTANGTLTDEDPPPVGWGGSSVWVLETQAGGGGATESISGTSAGTSADSAAASVAAALAGSSTGTSTDTAAASVAAALSGASAGTSTDTAAADVHVEGTATSAGTSLDTGTITARAALAGTSAGTSADSGALTEESDLEQLAGTSAGTSTDTGAVSVRAALSGTSAGTSTDTAPGTIRVSISGGSAGTSLDAGALAVGAALSGTSAGTSLDTGALRDASIPLVPSQTAAAAARDFTSTVTARPRVWVAPARD